MSVPKSPDLDTGIERESLQEGTMTAACWRGEKVLVAINAGEICVLSATCTHLGAPLNEGSLVGGELHCPWHHARFSLATGEALGAPAFAPLTRFDTEVRDGRVIVTGRRLAQPRAVTPARATPTAPRIVILGGGAAGYACAGWLQRDRFAGSVTIVSDDADPPYDRTFCSKQYLIGMKNREETLLSDPALKNTVESSIIRLGCTAHELDVPAKSLVLGGGERITFDVLVIATGAAPRRAHWPGADSPNVHVLRTLRDADGIIRAAAGATRVAVIGASFIGLEAAASLTQRKLEVHIVSPEDVPLKTLVGADVGHMIRSVHEEKGVHFHLGRTVRGFDGRRLTLDDGSVIEADFVVLGLGVTPRTEIAEVAGLACASPAEGGGVIVNEMLESSHPGIFAIGDIACYPDIHTGQRIRVEHWVHAQRQGQHVARVILGHASRFRDVPFFWSAHFDTGLRYLGHVESILDAQTDGSVERRNFDRLYRGSSGEQAYVTCNRDLQALAKESEWDRGH